MTRGRKARLDCDHQLWFVPPPRDGDVVWCRECKDYRTVGEANVNHGESYWPDYSWKSWREEKKYAGQCLVENCGHVERRTQFPKLRTVMENHHLYEHTTSTLVGGFKTVPIPDLPKGSPPPF